MTLPENAQIGDFAVIRTGNGFVDRGIRALTGHPPFLRPATYNHAELLVGSHWAEQFGKPADHIMLSFDADGGWLRPWRHDHEQHQWSTGKLGLSSAQGVAIASAAMGNLYGKGYGYVGIANIGLAQFGIHVKQLADLVDASGEYFCSQSVDQAYLLGGVHLFTDNRVAHDVTPQDLGDLVS